MSDLVVTVPRWFWFQWIAEGDAVGAPPSGEEWGFSVGPRKPPIEAGDRLYIVAWDRLRGFAPVTDVRLSDRGYVICRRSGAVAVTIDEPIKGFRGWRRPWWHRDELKPFEKWQTENVKLSPSLLARPASLRAELEASKPRSTP